MSNWDYCSLALVIAQQGKKGFLSKRPTLLRWEARASASSGAYLIYKSSEFQDELENRRRGYQQIIAHMTREGWRPAERDSRGDVTSMTRPADFPSVYTGRRASKERTHLARLPFEPEMILIPAGGFIMGSDIEKDPKAHEDEFPWHVVYLPDYSLAKTPVTNAQYEAFVQATSYHEPEWWVNGEPQSHEMERPVTYVSWNDAVAYCRWLSTTTGKWFRLPTEAEWEKGARGTDGRIYPWGNEWDPSRCNSAKNTRDRTTPVGTYPEGASPYGLLDLAGNAREWTSTIWRKNLLEKDTEYRYPYDPDDGREQKTVPKETSPSNVWRIQRSYRYASEVTARCAFREYSGPDDRQSGLGFRVALSFPKSYTWTHFKKLSLP
jgi:formylglycine-generating enzyme required for sulfatase activity